MPSCASWTTPPAADEAATVAPCHVWLAAELTAERSACWPAPGLGNRLVGSLHASQAVADRTLAPAHGRPPDTTYGRGLPHNGPLRPATSCCTEVRIPYRGAHADAALVAFWPRGVPRGAGPTPAGGSAASQRGQRHVVTAAVVLVYLAAGGITLLGGGRVARGGWLAPRRGRDCPCAAARRLANAGPGRRARRHRVVLPCGGRALLAGIGSAWS
jgi:hypothetical protein